MAKRCLFVIRHMPRARVSVAAMVAGEEALSGIPTATLLAAEGLARRGFDIGLHVVQGQELVDKSFSTFTDLPSAVAWIGGGPTVWSSCGDEVNFRAMRALGLKPIIWAHLPLTVWDKRALQSGDASGV